MAEVEQKFQKRQIAYKVRIKDILDSEYTKNEGYIPNFLKINGMEISRINIIGVVVQKSEINNYRTLVIDDGTGKISARVFENNLLLDKLGVGDVVLIIGRPREFSSEKYVLIEVIKKINPKWTQVRKLEQEKNLTSKQNKDSFLVEEKIHKDPTKSKILELIKELDKGDGVSVEDIHITETGDVDKLVDVLLKEGDVFEVRPGKIRILE